MGYWLRRAPRLLRVWQWRTFRSRTSDGFLRFHGWFARPQGGHVRGKRALTQHGSMAWENCCWPLVRFPLGFLGCVPNLGVLGRGGSEILQLGWGQHSAPVIRRRQSDQSDSAWSFALFLLHLGGRWWPFHSHQRSLHQAQWARVHCAPGSLEGHGAALPGSRPGEAQFKGPYAAVRLGWRPTGNQRCFIFESWNCAGFEETGSFPKSQLHLLPVFLALSQGSSWPWLAKTNAVQLVRWWTSNWN